MGLTVVGWLLRDYDRLGRHCFQFTYLAEGGYSLDDKDMLGKVLISTEHRATVAGKVDREAPYRFYWRVCEGC